MVQGRVFKVLEREIPLVAVAWLAATLLALSSTAAAAVPGHGRAWELVTTSETNGVGLSGVRGWSADGDRILFATAGSLPGAPSGDLSGKATATRTPNGWNVAPVGNPITVTSVNLLALLHPTIYASNPDLSGWLWISSFPLLPGAPSTFAMYRQSPDGELALLGNAGQTQFVFIDASANLEHAAFQTQNQLLPADAGRTQGSAAYEFAGSTLRLVGVDDSGTPLSPCGSMVGDGRFDPSGMLHAMSRDGRRIFFSAPPACGEPSRVYVREDGARTNEVSASSCSRPDCNAPQQVTFAGATPDGSRAFLITGQQLTDDDTDAGADLYRRDLPDGTLTRFSAGPPGVVASVSTPVRASDDGERVYFVATGALVPGSGVPGQRNLYLSDHGTLRFVAAVGDVDLSTSEITSDGGLLVFTTANALLASDLDSSNDVYRYDAASGTLTEVSLGAGGRGNEPLNADFNSTIRTSVRPPALSNEPIRHLTDDGRVFFVSSEALLPEDHNQTVDIYEWADGALGLVSSGMGGMLGYAGASADGRSVFFATDESVVGADRDPGDADLYVARLGGGFPEPPLPPPPCTGDACQGPPIGRVDRPLPDSLTVSSVDIDPQGASFGLRPLRERARRRLAVTGRVRLLVDVPVAGRLSLIARARMVPRRKTAGRLTVVGHAVVKARHAGAIRPPLRLSRAAVRALKARGSLRLTLFVRHSRLGIAPPVHVRLSKKTTRPRRRGTIR